VEVLQDRLQTLGSDWTVFEEDPELFCTLKQRLLGKFQKKLQKYGLLLHLVNQKHWRWQITMIWEVLFNEPIHDHSFEWTKTLINL